MSRAIWTIGYEQATQTAVIDALDGAFYRAFDNVKPTGKRLLLGLDVSGSMAGTKVTGMASMECRQAAGAMALVTAATETDPEIVAFDTSPYPLTISKRQRLNDVYYQGWRLQCSAHHPLRHYAGCRYGPAA